MPTPDEVVEQAIAALHELAPTLDIGREGVAVRIANDERAIVWNLHDVVRFAEADPEWRDGVNKQATQVIDSFNAPPREEAVSGALEVRLRPAARVPQEARDSSVVQEVWPGVVAICGHTQDGRMSLASREEIEAYEGSHEDLLKVLALGTLGPEFTLNDLVNPMVDNLPVFTNTEFHPHIAVSLLVPEAWQQIVTAFEPQPEKLYAVVPAASRIIFTTHEALIDGLRELADQAQQIEEELLTTQLLCFDGHSWRPVDA